MMEQMWEYCDGAYHATYKRCSLCGRPGRNGEICLTCESERVIADSKRIHRQSRIIHCCFYLALALFVAVSFLKMGGWL